MNNQSPITPPKARLALGGNHQSSISPLALSTAYLIPQCKSGDGLVARSKELGFFALELNIEITREMIVEIKKKVEEKEIEIISLHNFCPRPDYLPPGKNLLDAYQISSLDEEERKEAIELTKRTIDYTQELGAQAVVFHAGEVQLEINEGKLFRDFVHHNSNPDYLKVVRKEREERKKAYIENCLKSLDEIANYGAKKKVKIGLENRFFCHEIPSFEEFELFLSSFSGALGYWHDTGHAEISAKLGLVGSSEDYLRAYASKMIGVHLHDVVNFSDHRAPGTGEIDFSFLCQYMNSSVLRAVEAHNHSTTEEVKASIDYLKKVGIV